MIVQGGRYIARLPQLQAQCSGARRTFVSSTHVERVPALYTLLFPVDDSRKNGGAIHAASTSSRTYATRPVSRPKAHTGRTTSTRKTPTTSVTKAAKVPQPKKTTPKSIPKTNSKAKPRAKLKTKKKAKAKPKAKPKRKVLTEKQKGEKAAKARRDKIAELKKTALTVPATAPQTAWMVLFGETLKKGSLAPATAKEASVRFKQLSPEQLEHYNHIANQNKEKNEKAYRQFIESHTPLQIYEANLARNQLKRLSRLDPKKPNRIWTHLKDERQVKRPTTAYVQFSKDRQATNDYRGMTMPVVSGLVSREWKALTAAEKKPYEDRSAAESERFRQEVKTVLGKDPAKKKAPAA